MKNRNSVKSSKTPPDALPKIVSFVGRSNSGKTTLLTQLIPKFDQLGLQFGMIKNTHHKVEFDQPGKDSWKYAQSGCQRVLVSSGQKLAVFSSQTKPPTLQELSKQWFQGFDLVISEGFKNEECFKIEVIRRENQKSPLYTDPGYQIDGVVGDCPPSSDLPYFTFDQLDDLVQWICRSLNLKPIVSNISSPY